MTKRHVFYIVRRGLKDYLVALTGPDGETDLDKMRVRYSIYKHDAAKIPKMEQAKHVVNALRKDGEKWSISRYNTLTLYEEVVLVI